MSHLKLTVRLNGDGTNCILVCHALTGSAHAAVLQFGRRIKVPGWWDGIIGPGKALDTSKYFVVCSNILGGCYGTTGPTTINPRHDERIRHFISDNDNPRHGTHSERSFSTGWESRKIQLVIGGSMGGMQVLEWAVCTPKLSSEPRRSRPAQVIRRGASG